MASTDIIAKRELEIKIIKEQLAGVEQKLRNLTATKENLLQGLKRAEDSRDRQLELAKK